MQYTAALTPMDKVTSIKSMLAIKAKSSPLILWLVLKYTPWESRDLHIAVCWITKWLKIIASEACSLLLY